MDRRKCQKMYPIGIGKSRVASILPTRGSSDRPSGAVLEDSANHSAWWCNGSTSDSGSLSKGSNPFRAINLIAYIRGPLRSCRNQGVFCFLGLGVRPIGVAVGCHGLGVLDKAVQISIDNSEFRPYSDQLLASEFRSKFRQELAENVFASAVTGVTPVGVVLGVFDDDRLAGLKK